MSNKNINILISFIVYFALLSIAVGFVSLLMCDDLTKYGVPLLRVLIAGFFTYRHRFKILPEEE